MSGEIGGTPATVDAPAKNAGPSAQCPEEAGETPAVPGKKKRAALLPAGDNRLYIVQNLFGPHRKVLDDTENLWATPRAFGRHRKPLGGTEKVLDDTELLRTGGEP
jgi:hypothetical protein